MSSFDYRIVAMSKYSDTKFAISQVQYDEDGGIVSETPIINFSSQEEALGFTDRIYQASLKPVLEQLENGGYE